MERESEETGQESLQGVYRVGRPGWSPPSVSPGWEEGGTSDNLAAPTPIQEDVNPGISVEKPEVVSLAEGSGWEHGGIAGAYADLGGGCGIRIED
jgi:hypothetical protein